LEISAATTSAMAAANCHGTTLKIAANRIAKETTDATISLGMDMFGKNFLD